MRAGGSQLLALAALSFEYSDTQFLVLAALPDAFLAVEASSSQELSPALAEARTSSFQKLSIVPCLSLVAGCPQCYQP